jgi:hypothetical protein
MSFAKAKPWIVGTLVLLAAAVAFYFVARSHLNALPDYTAPTADWDNKSPNPMQSSEPESSDSSSSRQPSNSPPAAQERQQPHSEDSLPPGELPSTPDSSAPSPGCFFFTH